MRIRVLYFAQLQEEARRGEESIETDAATPRDVWTELRARYNFSLGTHQVLPAVDEEFRDWDHPLRPGSALAFLPLPGGG